MPDVGLIDEHFKDPHGALAEPRPLLHATTPSSRPEAYR
jgi:hypothetical protein